MYVGKQYGNGRQKVYTIVVNNDLNVQVQCNEKFDYDIVITIILYTL